MRVLLTFLIAAVLPALAVTPAQTKKTTTKQPSTPAKAVRRPRPRTSVRYPVRTNTPARTAAPNRYNYSRARVGPVRPVPVTARTQQGPTPDRYKEIQQALATKGYYKGELNGQWGPESIDALKRFQQDQNLTSDGKLNSLSLIALGLGPKRTTNQTTGEARP